MHSDNLGRVIVFHDGVNLCVKPTREVRHGVVDERADPQGEDGGCRDASCGDRRAQRVDREADAGDHGPDGRDRGDRQGGG